MSHRNLTYVKQDQPSFLRKFKERVGLKPEATVEDKRQALSDECNDTEKDDEKPTVVVLRDGDLTAEEASLHEKLDKKDDDSSEGKIVFRKPKKRSQDKGLTASTKKLKVDTDRDESLEQQEKSVVKEKKRKKTKVKVGALLSFDEDS